MTCTALTLPVPSFLEVAQSHLVTPPFFSLKPHLCFCQGFQSWGRTSHGQLKSKPDWLVPVKVGPSSLQRIELGLSVGFRYQRVGWGGAFPRDYGKASSFFEKKWGEDHTSFLTGHRCGWVRSRAGREDPGACDCGLAESEKPGAPSPSTLATWRVCLFLAYAM